MLTIWIRERILLETEKQIKAISKIITEIDSELSHVEETICEDLDEIINDKLLKTTNKEIRTEIESFKGSRFHCLCIKRKNSLMIAKKKLENHKERLLWFRRRLSPKDFVSQI